MNKSIIFRGYIVFLLVSLMMEINLFSILRFSIESVSPGLFVMAIGIVFPFFFIRDFMIFVKQRRLLFLLCSLFLIFGTISILNSPFPKGYGAKCLFQYGLNMGTSLILLFLFQVDRGLGRFFLKALIVIAFFCSLVAIIETRSQTLFHSLAETFRTGVCHFINGRLRPGATLGHTNILGCFLSMGILLILLLRECFGGKNNLFYSTVFLLGIGMALTGSRSAMLVLGIPLVFLLFNRDNLKTTLSVLIISIMCLIILTPSITRIADVWHLVANSENWTRENNSTVANPGTDLSTRKITDLDTQKYLSGLENSNGDPGVPSPVDAHGQMNRSVKLNSIEIRLMLWEIAVLIFKEYPLFGIGPGGYNRALANYASQPLLAKGAFEINHGYYNAHNGILNLLAEFGLAGIITTAFFFVFFFLNLTRRYRIWPPSAVHAVVLGLFISFGPDAFFYNNFYMVFSFSLLFLLGFGRKDFLIDQESNTKTSLDLE